MRRPGPARRARTSRARANRVHRPRDVQEEDERPRTPAPLPPGPFDRSPPVLKACRSVRRRSGEPSAQDRVAATGARDDQRQPAHHPPELGELGLGAAREALIPQQLDRAGERSLRLALDADPNDRTLWPHPGRRPEERLERGVVDRDVARPRDERRSPGPVEIPGREEGGGPAELGDAARPDRQPFSAEGRAKRVRRSSLTEELRLARSSVLAVLDRPAEGRPRGSPLPTPRRARRAPAPSRSPPRRREA